MHGGVSDCKGERDGGGVKEGEKGRGGGVTFEEYMAALL